MEKQQGGKLMFEYTRLKKKIDKLQEENHCLLKELDTKCIYMNYLTSRNEDLLKCKNALETSNKDLKCRLEESKAEYEQKSCLYWTWLRKYRDLLEAYRNLQNELSEYKKALDNQNDEIKSLNSELKEIKTKNKSISCSNRTFVHCHNRIYGELQDVYEKLSETEEQRKNMSQAYEDEYQTRLALQEENKKLKDQIKRNLNPYGGMY